jgi:hypothetical protein
MSCKAVSIILLSFLIFTNTLYAQSKGDETDLYFDAILDKNWKTADSLCLILKTQYTTEKEKADLAYYKGFEYYHKEDYKAALENYLEARQAFVRFKDSLRQAEIESAIVEVIGYLENDLVDYRPYLNSLCLIAESTQSQSLLFDCEYYKGYFKEVDGNFEEALAHYQETSRLTLAFKDTLSYYTNQINVGSMLIATQKYNEGLKLLDDAQNYYTHIGNVDRNFLILMHKSEGYRGKEDYDGALNQLEQAKALVENTPSLQNNYDLYHAYALVYESSKQFKKALEFHKKANAYHDSLYYIRAEKDIYNLKTKYEVVEKNNKIVSLENENLSLKVKKKNDFITILIISNSLLLLCVLFLIMYRKYRKSQKEVRQLQKRIDKLRHNKVHRSSKSISLKNKTVLDSKDILYIKSDGHYVEYHLEDKTSPIVERRSLTKTLENLPENEFTRVHKSYVVNLYRLKIINSTQLMLDTGEWIPLSRTYKPALKELLNKK